MIDEIRKNEIYSVCIEDMSDEGLGIGHINGMTVFVKDTAVGDEAEVRIVKVKKNLCFGRLEKLTVPSKFRCEPVCPVARQCGGCTLQHITYEKEVEIKKDRVLGCLKRIGGIENPEQYLEEVHGMDDISENSFMRYRNKMQFPVGLDKDGKTVTGFYAGRTHSIIPVDDCIIGHAVNKYITDGVCKWADDNNIQIYDEQSGKGLLRHILTRIGFKTGQLMVTLVINGSKLPFKDELIDTLNRSVAEYLKDVNSDIKLTSVAVNINKKNTNKIIGDKTVYIYGEQYIEDYIGDVKFRISADSFYQVNPSQTKLLYDKALEYAALTGKEKVWDMYCGIGTISLFLAKKAEKVFGVEIVPQAIEDAEKNAALNDIKNTRFFVGKAEDVVTELYEKSETPGEDDYKADVVVVDPPRKGCDEKLLETIVKMAPEKLVYVSCNPATLARDLKILLEHDFSLKKISIHDQFPRGMNIETVVLLNNKFAKAKDFVQIGIDAEDYYRIKDAKSDE